MRERVPVIREARPACAGALYLQRAITERQGEERGATSKITGTITASERSVSPGRQGH